MTTNQPIPDPSASPGPPAAPAAAAVRASSTTPGRSAAPAPTTGGGSALTPGPRPPAAGSRTVRAAALAASALGATLGLLAPQVPQLGEPFAETLLGTLLGAGTAALLLVLVSLLGVGTGIAALAGVLPRPGLVLVAGLQMFVVGVGLGSMSTLSTAGYLLAMAMPLIAGALLVQSIRRYPRARPMLLTGSVLAVGGGAVLLGSPLRELAGYLLPAVVAELPLIGSTLLMVAVGALWAAAGALALRGTVGAARATAWVTRHRVLFTVLAACGPLPYALARLSWLTPWPVFGAEQAMDLSVRLWGLTLSSGSWLAVILTIGLIRPWGEVFPRWMPVVAGRSVPIAAAAVPGGAVAALLSFAAGPLLVGAAVQGQGPAFVLTFALVFPCWLWGPALALAVWGYVGHRRAQQRRAGSTVIPGAGRA